MRYLALDVGEKTIGMAVSDPLGIVHRPLGTWARQGTRGDLDALSAAVAEHEVSAILVGYPVHMSGEAGGAAERVARLARRLKARTGLPVLGVDERFSTLEAGEILRDPSRGRGRRRPPDDHAVAAALILRRYLEEGESVVLARW